MRYVGIAAVMVALAGGAVLAHEQHAGGHDFMRRHMSARIDAALDAAKATPEQKQKLEGARDRVFATFHANHQNQRAQLEKLLGLFEADKIDAAQLSALRKDHEAMAKSDGDAVVQALVEAHDTLSAEQRKALVEHVRAHKMEAPPKAAADWMKKRALSHVEDALDQVKASPEQKNAVEAALEQVFTTMQAEHQANHLDEAMKLFEADRIDQSKLAELRTAHQAQRAKVGDAIVQAFHDVHDALTSAQRKQLVTFLRSQHHFGG